MQAALQRDANLAFSPLHEEERHEVLQRWCRRQAARDLTAEAHQLWQLFQVPFREIYATLVAVSSSAVLCALCACSGWFAVQ
jgi:hypothetical protein